MDSAVRAQLVLVINETIDGGTVMRTETIASQVKKVDPFDAREFRKCLSQYATGVTIVTSLNEAGPVGVTANSFSSLSLDPPLVLWSIGRSSRSCDAFINASHFAINILTSDQIDLSQKFSSKEVDKFVDVDWSPGVGGVPVLKKTLASIECSQQKIYDGGDHVIIVGLVERFSTFDGDGLVFAQGRYRIAGDHPSVASNPASASKGEATGAELPARFFMQLFWAFHYMSENFEEYRAAANVTLAQGRVLSRLDGTDGLTVQELVTRSYLTSRVCEDAIAELIEQGCISQRVDGRYVLTDAGHARRQSLAEGELKFEQRQLRSVSPEDFAATRRVLSQIIKLNGGSS